MNAGDSRGHLQFRGEPHHITLIPPWFRSVMRPLTVPFGRPSRQNSHPTCDLSGGDCGERNGALVTTPRIRQTVRSFQRTRKLFGSAGIFCM